MKPNSRLKTDSERSKSRQSSSREKALPSEASSTEQTNAARYKPTPHLHLPGPYKNQTYLQMNWTYMTLISSQTTYTHLPYMPPFPIQTQHPRHHINRQKTTSYTAPSATAWQNKPWPGHPTVRSH